MNTRDLVLALALLVSFAASPQQWIGVDARLGGSVKRFESVEDGRKGYCSAVVINNAKGYVLTAAHCLPPKGDSTSITVDRLHAEVIKFNHVLDLAVLHVPGVQGKQIYLRKEPAVVGMPVAVVGYALAAERVKYTFGYISDPIEDRMPWSGIYVDAEIVPGQSGGVIVDEAGRLVGVTQLVVYKGISKLGVGADVKTVAQFAGEYWGKPERQAASTK